MKKFYLNLKLHVLKTVIFFSTVLILLVFGNSALAQTTTVNLTTPGANSWTVPCGVTSLTVEAWGGGGAGGSATIVSNGGAGGGGGGYSTYTVGVTPGQIINYTIGSGGSGGSGNGGDGSATTILALTANGGTGGSQDQGTAGSGGTASGGTTNTTGGNGTIGSATTGEAGGNGANGGIGGPAITTESNGNDGTAPGGGGGGGLLLAGAGPSNGGNGGSGQITITYNTPAVLAAPTPVTPSSGISICNGKSTNLNATSAGNTINWYTVPTGGTSIGSSASGVDFSVSPTADTTYYAEAESSPGCVSATRTATGLVTVTALPVITTQPAAPAAVCAGNGTRTIDVTATGTSLTYQWRKNGTNLTNGAPYTNVTTASMSITNPAISENGASFDVVITDAQGCFVTSNAVALTVNALPAITTQPATPTAICAGTGTRTISVTATGTSLTYQWRKNGTNLTNTAPYSNVTTATMTITSPAFSENGASFDVVVTNAQGCTITSNAVLLTVNPAATAATIVTPTTPQTICNGSSINLNATSTGNNIYWYTASTGGTNLGNVASGVNFSVTPANNTTTTYYADARTASNCFSATRTATATITTIAAPTITTQPVAPTPVCAGSGTRTISITAGGTPTYQWRRNGVDLTNVAPYSGVTTNTLTITNPGTADAGTFTVVLNSGTCPLTSNSVALTVNPLPTAPTGVTPSSPVNACTTAGTTPLTGNSAGNTIDWYTVPTGGTSIGSSSGNGANFLVSAPTATVYYAESRNAATGCVSSTRIATASVTSNVLPVINTQPTTPAAVCAGSGTVTINVATTGATSIQWRKNGTNLTNTAPYSGVTTNTLTITNPPIGDNGATFDVVLNNSNATCPVTSNSVTLTVNASPSAPTAVTPSSPSTFCSGSGTINLNATSLGNTIYWYTVATGGTSIGNSASGVNLAVSPASTVTYYAEARNATGCNSPTRTATGTITVIVRSPLNIEFTENQDDNQYTINICGNIAASENDLDVNSGNPGGGVNAPNFGPATGQWQVSYDNQATWVNAPGPTSTVPQYKFDPAYTTFESVAGTYYFRLILKYNGCTDDVISDVIKLTVIGDPTLNPGSVAGNQSSCPAFNPAAFTQTAPATVGTMISGYNLTYQWQSSTDNVNFTNIAGATATTYDPPNTINVTTYYRRYAIYGTAGGGCSAASNTLTVSVGTLPTPIVGTITQPTCTVATGSVPLSGLPSGNWTINPGGITGNTTTTTITGLAAGTYNFTVTQSTCTSPATVNVVINAQPAVPAVPTASVTAQPTCATPKGTITVTAPIAANISYTLTGTAPVVAPVTQTGTTFANLNPGNYTLYTTNTASTCTSSTISLQVNAIPSTSVPTISNTAASCSAAGTSTISNYNAGFTYAFTPTGPTVGAGGLISGMTVGTSYTVRATNGSCTQSIASASFSIAPQLPTPPVPTLTSTAASCSAAGTSTISNYAAGNTYTFNPTGPTVAAGGAISGMTVGTSYTVTATSGSCTSAASASFSNAAQLLTPTAPTLSAGTINCNDFTANWTASANVTGYRIDVATDSGFTSILPAYNNLLLGSGVLTSNVTSLASGSTFYIRVRAENGCGASVNSNTLTITTGSSNTAFTTDVVQPNCVLATGKITVNESVVNPSDQYSFDDGVTYQSSNVKDLLPAGTYKVRIKNTNGCETLATTIVLNPTVVTTYNGTWSNGVPTSLTKAIFASNYTFTSNLQACSCEVNAGVTVTVNPGFSLVLENGIDVSGSIIFENNSSLIQTNNVVNTGNITYKRNTTPVGKFDYTYWSSPVSPQTLLNVSPTTLSDKYFSWDAVGAAWKVEPTGTVMGKGIGYIIRGPQGNLSPAIHTASFVGVPNNGNISYSIAGAGLDYLIGNPYPSALNADAFLDANPALDGTIYFWTHNTAITQSGSFYVYNSNDYASYNGVGGTATQAAINPGVNNSVPSGEIASGQAFFATSNAAGTITFENTMRVGLGGAILNNSQFFKGTKEKTTAELKKHRVWLNFSNTEGAFKQMLIGYVTSATNGFDNRFDGKTMDSNTYVDFYSINESNKLTIQGRALPFDILDQIPLGYKTTIEGTFSINIDQVDGILASIPIFLEDKTTGTVVNLKNGAYSFSTVAGTFDDRFVLRYINSSIKIPDFTTINFDEWIKKVLVSVKNRHIKINSYDQIIDNVTVFDLSRRKLYEKGNINSNEFNVPEFSSANQFLMVQIRLKNGKLVTEKIIF